MWIENWLGVGGAEKMMEWGNFNRDYAENAFGDFNNEDNGRLDGAGEDKLQSDLDCDSDSDPEYTDEDNDSEEGADVGAPVLGDWDKNCVWRIIMKSLQVIDTWKALKDIFR